MDSETKLETSCDGCVDSCLRQCAGEGGCFNTFSGPGFVTFGFDEPGDMLAFGVTPESSWILNAGAFIAGSTNLEVSSQCSGCSAICLGEELFFTKVTVENGVGVFFAGGYGNLIRHEIPDKQSMFVNNSLFFAAHSATDISARIFGGFCTCCFGKEGLVMKFDGPCVVYTQSRDPTIMKQLAAAKLRRKNAGKGGSH
jgi:uncharacterized protein (AIM24 family)